MHSEFVFKPEFEKIVSNMKEKLGSQINVNTQSVTLKPFAYRETKHHSFGDGIEIFRLEDIIKFNQDDKLELSKMSLKCPYCSEDVYLTGFKEKSRVKIHFRHKSSGMEGVEKNKCIYTCRHKDLVRAAFKGMSLEQLYKTRSDNFKVNQSKISLPNTDLNMNSKIITTKEVGKYKETDFTIETPFVMHSVDSYIVLFNDLNKQRKIPLLNNRYNAELIAKACFELRNRNTVLIPIVELKNDKKIFSLVSKFGNIKSFLSSKDMLEWLNYFSIIRDDGLYYLHIIIEQNNRYRQTVDMVNDTDFHIINRNSYLKAIKNSRNLCVFLLNTELSNSGKELLHEIDRNFGDMYNARTLTEVHFCYDSLSSINSRGGTIFNTRLKSLPLHISFNSDVLLTLKSGDVDSMLTINLGMNKYVYESLIRTFDKILSIK